MVYFLIHKKKKCTASSSVVIVNWELFWTSFKLDMYRFIYRCPEQQKKLNLKVNPKHIFESGLNPIPEILIFGKPLGVWYHVLFGVHSVIPVQFLESRCVSLSRLCLFVNVWTLYNDYTLLLHNKVNNTL